MATDDRMTILHVAPAYLPGTAHGGPLVSIHRLCQHLARRGHDVRVFSTNMDGSRDMDVPLEASVDLDGVSVTYFPVPRHGRRLVFSPAMGRGLARHVPHVHVLHVHQVFQWTTYAATRRAAKVGVPYLLSPKGSLVPELIRGRSRFIKQGWLRLIDRGTLARAAFVQANSQHEYECMQRLALHVPQARVVPNGVEVPPLPDAKPLPPDLAEASAAPYAIFLGRLSWEKGLERLFAALHGTPIRMLIAGDGAREYVRHLESLVASLGLQDTVKFVGPVHGAAKWALLRGARFLALTSHSESFGNVVTEAMAVGRPVAVVPEVGARDVVTASGGGIVAEAKPETFRSALLKLWTDPDTCERLGSAGAVYVREQLSWERVAETMEHLYRDAIAQRRTARS